MTTQNERLRALLKEARETNGCHGVCVTDCIWSRIDAALSEPVEGGGCLQCYAFGELRAIDLRKNDEAQAEIRNVYAELREARAEVEQLKIVLDSIRAARSLLGQLRDHVSDHAYAEMMCILSDEPLNADGDLYATPSQQAYRRGAEAMREAAANEVNRLLTERKATAIWVGPNEIRALAIPEDKP